MHAIRTARNRRIIGTLNIARPPGFIPNVRDAFPILTCGSNLEKSREGKGWRHP